MPWRSRRPLFGIRRGTAPATPQCSWCRASPTISGSRLPSFVGEDPKGNQPALAGMFRDAAAPSEDDRALMDQMMKMLIQRQREGANKEP